MEFQGGRAISKAMPCARLDFKTFLARLFPLPFKAYCLPLMQGGFRQAKCHVVAQTQDCHVVCIWGS